MAYIFISIVIVVIVIYVMLSPTKLSQRVEGIRGYQNFIQPFWLSPQAQKLWMKPAINLCHSRVSSECSGLPYEQRIGCVQQKLMECENANEQVINNSCSAQLPNTICRKRCSHPNSLDCIKCKQYVQRFGVCSKPDLSI
jgi:hypothetical protein